MFLIFNNYMYQCICGIHCHSVLLHVDVTNYFCGSLSVQLICHIHFLFNSQSLTSMDANCFSNPDNLKEVLQNGSYQGVALKGATPSMTYKESIIDGFIAAIQQRFNLNKKELDVISSTKILNMKNWPAHKSSDIQGSQC